MDEQEKKALEELCHRAVQRKQPLFSRFLDLDGQKAARIFAQREALPFMLFGGLEDCERKMLGVGGNENPFPEDFPIACLHVLPRNDRFSIPFTHRDLLGALMGLGIKREVTGDILTDGNEAYLFCADTMADYICDHLTQVGKTDIDCERAVSPAKSLRKTVPVRIQVSSERLDAVVAHLCHLSRGDAAALFRQSKISVDDALCLQCDRKIRPGETLSVRGHGRFRFDETEGLTKKGKTVLLFQKYS